MACSLAHRPDANNRPRGKCLVDLEWRRGCIVASIHMGRRYLHTGREPTRGSGERVIEMMARDYFLERLWLRTDGASLWEQQPLAL